MGNICHEQCANFICDLTHLGPIWSPRIAGIAADDDLRLVKLCLRAHLIVVEQFSLQSLAGQPPYPYVDGELRKVARDAYVEWQGSRYSVPWKYAGQQVWVRQQACEIQVRCGSERIAMHSQAVGQHQVVTRSEHHAGIPLSGQLRGKTLIHIQQSAPVVEVRSLAVYESACLAGVQ